MEGLAAAAAAIAIMLGALLLVSFMVFCLVRISVAEEARFLPKWAWALLVVGVNPLGGMVFLLSQQLRTRRLQRG